jgi:glycosyltransferase involved in cell wall biosynthesis
MHVLHVISAIDPVRGGPITALLGMVQAQADAGMHVQVATTWIDGESLAAAEALRKQGIDVTTIGPCKTPLRRHEQIVPALSKLIQQTDVVDIHALYEEIQHQAARLARRFDVPYIIRPEGMLTPWSLAQSRLKKKLYMLLRLRRDLDHAAAIAFTSEAECDATAPLKLAPRSIVEPLGVDLREFQHLPAPGSFRSRHPRLVHGKMIAFLGRIHPGKGLELLIPAFARTGSDETLVIIGPDSENFRARVESMISDAGITDRVIFTGMLRGPDRIAALADADLFALPSFHENFGLAVVEALAAGVPVIISNEVNLWKEIEAGGVGAVVPTQIEPLAAKLEEWLSNDALRAAAAGRARQFVSEHYDWDRIARRWEGHYAKLTEHKLVGAASD